MSTLSKIISDLKLVSKNSDNEIIGFNGEFVAEARISDKLDYKLNSPDNYVEDGYHINDHIIREPFKLTISGEISDLVVRVDKLTEKYNATLSDIGVVSQYSPSRTQTQLSKIKNFAGLPLEYNRRLEKVKSDASYINATSKRNTNNPQIEFINFIQEKYQLAQLISIETSLGIYNNMILESCELIKEESSYLSYSISLKEFRVAQTKLVGLASIARNPKGDANSQTKNKSDKGEVQGDKKDPSTLYKIGSFAKGLFK